MNMGISQAASPRVSVVVACRNEAARIGEFLASMYANAGNPYECEFLIADGQSTDGTADRVRDFAVGHPGVRCIDNPERIVSTGLNRAIQEARGEIVVRMDAHTEYAADYVAECVRALEQTGAANVGGPARTQASGYMAEAIAAAYHSPFTCGGARFHQEDYEGYVDTVTYGCWRRQTLLDVGLFDPALTRNQDDELNFRIVRAGGKIWQTPRIRSWYSPRSSLKRLFQQYFQYGFWKVAVIRKHGSPASWRHLVPVALVAFLLMGPLAAALGGWLAAGLWMAGVAVYLLACVAAAAVTAAHTRWSLLPILPVVIATYHIAYGAGFLWGMLFGTKRRDASGGKENALTALTR